MSREMKKSGVEWIGDIPKENNIIRTKYLISYIKGKNPNELNNEKLGVPYIGASDLDKEKSYNEYENYTLEDLPSCDYEDILVLWDGARAGLIGRNQKGVISSTITNIIPNEKIILKNFYYWYLKGFEKYLYDMVGGTTIPHMNRKHIENIYMIDFSLQHQLRIADFLDKKISEIDNIITKTKLTIEEYKKYKKSIITETVTKGLNQDAEMKDSGIDWIGDIPEHWKIMNLNQIFSQVKDRNKDLKETNLLSLSYGKIIQKDINTNNGLLPENFEGYNIINNGNIVLRLTDLQNDHTSLRVGLCTQTGIITSAYISLHKKFEIDEKYAYYYLHSFDIYKGFYGMGSGVRQGLTYDGVKKLKLLYPPITEQEKIVNYLDIKISGNDKLIFQKQQLLTELESYKKSLIYECVTGKREV